MQPDVRRLWRCCNRPHHCSGTGNIVDTDRPGTAIHQGGLLAKLAVGRLFTIVEIRSPIPAASDPSRNPAQTCRAGAEIAVVDPATEQVWEALRALYLIGQIEDLPAIQPYERDLPDIPNDVRQQAQETEKAIRTRAAAN